MTPRILIVAYDFPPHGAIGTMRTLRLVRELAREGWAITVLTSSPETYLPGTPIDTQLGTQVPAGVTVLRARAIRGLDAFTRGAKALRRGGSRPETRATKAEGHVDPAGPAKPGWLRRASDWLDAALSIPDNESGWILPSTARGLRHVLFTSRPDVIYSSAPPWSGQVVAWALAAISRRPWVADFRDPWARAPWRDWRKPFRQRAAAWFERRVVERADAVLFVTKANLQEFAASYGADAARRFHLVPNGCDPAEIEVAESMPARPHFVMLHAGTLYGARNPLPVINAVAAAVRRGAIDPAQFRLRFLGNVSLTTDLPRACRDLGIEDVVEFVPRVTRAESLRELKSASALLLVQTGTTMSVPGKAYEYLAAGRPILALSEEGETAELVRASGIGVSVPPTASPQHMERALLEVCELAARPVAAPRALYDGSIHARTTAGLLRALASRGARDASKQEVIVAAHGSVEETRR
jgi:glycosyltransferase involved in cell wall biosynthesis